VINFPKEIKSGIDLTATLKAAHQETNTEGIDSLQMDG